MPTPYISPRIAHLQQELAAGNQAALTAFWEEVKVAGTPLIEPLEGDETQTLATFLWQDPGNTENVVLLAEFAGMDLAKNQLTPLVGSDLWYRSERIPRDTRTSYRLAPNDSLVPLSEVPPAERRARMAHWQVDPLNPRVFVFPKDEEDPDDVEIAVSLLELPGAPPQPWSSRQAAVPAGRVEVHRFRSTILGNERRVWLYTPPGYSPQGGPYHLLVLFDGWAYIDVVPTHHILDNLLAAGKLPPFVAVIPDSLTPETRSRELPCYPPFMAFLTQELLPWVQQHYAVTADPSKTVVGGASFGGLAAAFAALTHPERFGAVLSQSGSFWWKPAGAQEHEWLTRQFALTPQLPLRFYLDVGLFEKGPTPDNGPAQLVCNRHMRDVLQAKGYEVEYVEYSGGHNYICWRGSLADGLLALGG
jgi:enterochelin esterase-like enzyme